MLVAYPFIQGLEFYYWRVPDEVFFGRWLLLRHCSPSGTHFVLVGRVEVSHEIGSKAVFVQMFLRRSLCSSTFTRQERMWKSLDCRHFIMDLLVLL